MSNFRTKIEVRHLSVTHGGVDALSDLSFDVNGGGLTVVLGAADSGKTELLRALTRLHLDESIRVTGSVEIRGEQIYASGVDLAALHRKVGLVLSAPWLFPGSIVANVAYGLRVAGRRIEDINHAVEASLRVVGLWAKLRMNLDGSPADLTREEQLGLCIARAVALEPEVLLLDDPARNLDHLGRRRLEELLGVLRARCTVVLATRDVGQAARLADDIVFLHRGRVLDSGAAKDVLGRPRAAEMVEYIAAYMGERSDHWAAFT